MVTKKASMIPNFLISRKPPSVNEIIKGSKITDFEPLQKNKKNKENNGDWTVYKGKKTNLNYGGKKRYANPVRKPNVKKESGLNIKGNIGGRKKKDKKTGAKFTTDDLNISADARYKGLGLGGTFTQSQSRYSPMSEIERIARQKYIGLRVQFPVNENISVRGGLGRGKEKFKYNDPFYRTSGSSKPEYGYTVGATYDNPDSGIEGYIEGSNRPGQPSTGRKRKLGVRAGLKLRFNKGGSVRGRKANYGR